MQIKSNKKCPKCNRNLYTSLMSPDEVSYTCLYCDFEKIVKIKGLGERKENKCQEND